MSTPGVIVDGGEDGETGSFCCAPRDKLVVPSALARELSKA